jgi:hypothetical protein
MNDSAHNPAKKGFNPQDFMTRAERRKQMSIPTTDEKRIIVQPNKEGMGFKFDCYAPEILTGLLDKERFNKTVYDAHRIVENKWLKKRKEEEIDINAKANYVLGASTVLVLIAFILIIVMIWGADGDSADALLYVATALFAIAGSSTSVLVIRSLFIQPKFMNLEAEVRTELSAYLDKENKQFYKAKGFEWEMQENFYWLELHNYNQRRDTELEGLVENAKEDIQEN